MRGGDAAEEHLEGLQDVALLLLLAAVVVLLHPGQAHGPTQGVAVAFPVVLGRNQGSREQQNQPTKQPTNPWNQPTLVISTLAWPIHWLTAEMGLPASSSREMVVRRRAWM